MLYKDMISSVLFVISVVVSAILAAPVTQNKELGSLGSQIQAQEQALETLAAKSQKGVPQNLQLARTFSYSNINGAENRQNNFEERVLDPIKGGITTDLKEKLTEAKASADSPVEKSFKGSLDVPALGIHKEVTDSGEEPENEDQPEKEFQDTVEFTPKAVAEYLARTGEIDEFKELLNELVEASEITSEDAEGYEKSVMDEYFKMIQETNKATGDDTVPQLPANRQPLNQGFNSVDQNEVFPLYGYGQEPFKTADEARMDMYINYLMNRPVTLDEMISSLMDEWLTRAIISGDPEAEEILSNIVDYVTRDDNPNDEEQVREILGDIFAEALLEDLTPRIEPQSLPDVPAVGPSPVESEDEETQLAASETIKEPAEEETNEKETKPEKVDELVQTGSSQEQGEGRPKN